MLRPQNYLVEWATYDVAHSGKAKKSAEAFDGTERRYPLTLRDLAAYTWSDYPTQAYQEAAIWLQSNHPKAFYNPNVGRPYNGFLTYQLPYVIELINKAASLPLRATWYHKWLVHMTTRPEEVGAEVERLRTGLQAPYPGQPLPEDVLPPTDPRRQQELTKHLGLKAGEGQYGFYLQRIG
jgi:hypothetical protein